MHASKRIIRQRDLRKHAHARVLAHTATLQTHAQSAKAIHTFMHMYMRKCVGYLCLSKAVSMQQPLAERINSQWAPPPHIHFFARCPPYHRMLFLISRNLALTSRNKNFTYMIPVVTSYHRMIFLFAINILKNMKSNGNMIIREKKKESYLWWRQWTPLGCAAWTAVACAPQLSRS